MTLMSRFPLSTFSSLSITVVWLSIVGIEVRFLLREFHSLSLSKYTRR